MKLSPSFSARASCTLTTTNTWPLSLSQYLRQTPQSTGILYSSCKFKAAIRRKEGDKCQYFFILDIFLLTLGSIRWCLGSEGKHPCLLVVHTGVSKLWSEDSGGGGRWRRVRAASVTTRESSSKLSGSGSSMAESWSLGALPPPPPLPTPRPPHLSPTRPLIRGNKT